MTAHRRPFRTAAVLVTLTLAGCGVGGITMTGEPGPAAPRGVPGFDTRTYPGDDVMAAWLDASPYRWVGFYLEAPCHTGTSWLGSRARLRAMGWGLAVLFVGEQDWPADVNADHVHPDPATDELRCTRDNLSEGRGRRDGEAAAASARAEGFAPPTVVYLDVEPVDSVSSRLAEYVRGWTTALSAAGYGPGLYAHARNADRLMQIMEDAAPSSRPRLWVARPGGFSLRRGPTESGFPATIWQGILDARETWAGTTLRIDANVADRAHPSG